MADLDELLNRLKAQHSNHTEPTTPVNLWQQSQQPPVGTPQPVSRPSQTHDQQTSNTLLNLLNIRTQMPQQAPQRAASSFASTSTQSPVRAVPVRLASSSAVPVGTGEPPSSTQKYLLDLLTKSKPEDLSKDLSKDLERNKSEDQTAVPSFTEIVVPPSPQKSPVAEPLQTSKSGIFKYVNPFDQLHASSPLNAATPVDDDTMGHLSVTEKLETVGQEVGNQAERALAQAESANDTAPDEVASNWSTAEDEDAKLEEEEKVEVFNFPMKPFVTLALKREHTPRTFRLSTWERSTPVARLKKDFSHDDRSLATASQAYIVYSVPPTDKKPASGLKLIRQDDGKNKHLWNAHQERICNVQIGTTDDTAEAILATGVNGTIFFATLPSEDDDFGELQPDQEGIAMSPPPNSDEPAQPTDMPSIRTRTKLSNTKPTTCFAAARGRQIHVIAPKLAKLMETDQRNNVDTEKYLSEYSYSINTGKACKDFCFSEDDTVIVSLDKLSRLKFWDVRSITSAIEQGGSISKVLLKDPIHTILLAAVNSKADVKLSPTSIIFVDKERAHAKKVALRYVLIGFQQNHVLQLWDLGLGRCVQELRLPDSVGQGAIDSEESKGLCSVVYHPKSSIIVVGHPGRNSIYLIHLSAPKYNLNPLTQVSYLAALASKDFKAAPKPDNTAIMSGLREFSCARIGQLRSVDILKTPFQPNQPDTEDEVLFEIYAMHSKGVLGIPITRDDLGWDAKGKLIKPVDAVERGVVAVSDLNEVVHEEETSRASSGSASASSKAVPNGQPAKPKGSTLPVKPITQTKATKQVPSSTPTKSVTAPVEQVLAKSDSEALPKSTSPIPPVQPIQNITLEPSLRNGTSKIAVPDEQSGRVTLEATLQEQFSQLYKKLDNDKRINEAAGAAKQDAVLRLVSSTLTENVENSLQRIVITNIQQHILPAINEQIVAAVKQNVSESLHSSVRDHLASILPAAVTDGLRAALTDLATRQSFSTAIAQDVSKGIQDQVKAAVQKNVQQLESGAAKHHKDLTASISKLATARDADDGGASVLRRLEESEARITAMLTSIQQEQSELRAALEQDQTKPKIGAPKQIEAPESDEVQHLTHLLNDGKFEQATIEWLQSNQQAELFDQLFVRINPQYLKHVSSLVALSVSAAVSASLESNVDKRLEWLGSVISNVDVEDQEIRDVAPKIMEVLMQRLQGTYMHVSETQPANQEVLRRLAALTRLISNTRKAFD